jgi:transposase
MNIKRALTSEHEQEITVRYRRGETADQLATAFNVARRTIYNILHREDVKRTRAHHSLSEGQEKEILERYARGESVQSISRDFSVHMQTIRNMIKKRGAVDAARAQPVISVDQRKAIVEACRQGATATSAAGHFGVSTKTVFRYLRDAGVSLPKGSPLLRSERKDTDD